MDCPERGCFSRRYLGGLIYRALTSFTRALTRNPVSQSKPAEKSAAAKPSERYSLEMIQFSG